MPTIWVREFAGGLDARRLPEMSAGGTLIRGVNGHINRGKEFEQRSDFVHRYNLPANAVKGLAAVPQGLTVFGHTTRPFGLHGSLRYQRLQHPQGRALQEVLYTSLYRGRLVVSARFADDSVHLFYDGNRITDSNAPPNAVATDQPGPHTTFREKLFAAGGATLYNSAVLAPMDFGDGSGAGDGVTDMSTHEGGVQKITGLARYDQYLAIFSRDVIQIWFFDPDPALSRENQVLGNTGTMSPRSVTQFGDGDVFYLARSGVRSLRARDSSNSAATTDVGSGLDPIIRDDLDRLTEEEIARAQGIIEPRDGRFWLLLGGTIYVFSYFTGSDVRAWTVYDLGFPVDELLVWNGAVWIRSGNSIYSFGAPGGKPVYSADTVAECWLPYLDADEPTRAKTLTGFDAAVRGTWEVRAALDPMNEGASDLLGRVEETTFRHPRLASVGQFNHISLRFRTTAPPSPDKPAVLSSCVIHFDRDDEEDSS